MTNSPLVTERDLARTYDGSAYDDAWQAVEQYRHVRQYQADHPEKGYTAIANALEYPLGRVRSWYDGRTPYVVDALETAHDYGWVGISPEDSAFGPLNILVAAIYSGGSINSDNWAPQFVLNEHGFDSPVVGALESLGIEYADCESEDGNRSPAICPAHDGALLGRVLYILGGPLGKKSQLEDFSLPDYLDDAPADIRESWIRTYLLHRGYEVPDSDSIQIHEDRPQSYRRELAELIESVAGAPVRAGEQSVTVSADAARALEVAPRYAAGE